MFVALDLDTSYRNGDQDTVSVVIIDNDQQYPPVIVSQPSDVSVLEGDAATFMVNATGTSPLTYQWRKNGTPVGEGSSASYTISNVLYSDSGSLIYCIVANSAGSDTSRQALLSVALRPQAPWITRKPLATSVAEGDTAEFSVGVNGTPPFSYQWFCDTAALAGKTDSILRYGPVSLSDNGKKFYCQITNSVSGILTQHALLTVKRPSSQTIIITGDLMTTRNMVVGAQDETRMNFIVNLYPSFNSDVAVYTESFLDTNKQAIKVKNGRFTVHLGTGQTNDNLMDVVRQYPNIFVSFSISSIGGNFETLDRRVPLTASPYALSSLPQLLKGNVNPDSASIEAPIGTHYVRTTTNATYIRTHRGWAVLE